MDQLKPKQSLKKFNLTFLPFDVTVKVTEGTTILEAIRKINLPLKASCGGRGTCGDCLVKVLSGNYQVNPSAALPANLINRNYTLACQTKVKDNLCVQLPQFEELKIKTVHDYNFFDNNKENLSGHFELSPPVKKIKLNLPKPSLKDNYSDLKRLQRELQKAIGRQKILCEYSVLKKLASTIRQSQGKISVVLSTLESLPTIIDIETTNERFGLYGLAIDIGTTTVVLHLVDLENGEIVDTTFTYNPQLKCGEDIISRINYSLKPGRLQELHELIIHTINNLITKAISASKISSSHIYLASVSGNTTMIHLLLNLDPNYIRLEPYVPTINQVPIILARELGLNMNNEGRVYCAPSIGSYVGGDITAGLLFTPLYRDSEKISLFIDAGTNGELVIGNRDWLITCACSIGPAFEGRGIKSGMPATTGAIENLKITSDGQIHYKVINGTPPQGICGSGLIDLLAELFVNGYIDRQGKFTLTKDNKRLIYTENGPGFLIEKANNCYWEKDLYVTENEISNLLRSKAAVYSACSFLLKKLDLDFDQVQNIYLAGGFGQHLNIENAIRIGLLPDLNRHKFHYLGNTSLAGSYLVLMSDKNRQLVEEIANKMTYIELNIEPSYMDEFIAALFLPHTNINLFPSVKDLLNQQDLIFKKNKKQSKSKSAAGRPHENRIKINNNKYRN